MEAALLMLGLLVGGGGEAGVVKIVTPIKVSRPIIEVDVAFQTPVAADIQLLEPSDYGWSDCEAQFGKCDPCSDAACDPIRYDLCHPPTDMMPHMPDLCGPKTYYYFRPYNWAHIGSMQSHAATWGGDSATPYSNKIFEAVYAEFEEEIQGDSAN